MKALLAPYLKLAGETLRRIQDEIPQRPGAGADDKCKCHHDRRHGQIDGDFIAIRQREFQSNLGKQQAL